MRAEALRKRTVVQALHEVQDGGSMYFVTGESMDSVTKQCSGYSLIDTATTPDKKK